MLMSETMPSDAIDDQAVDYLSDMICEYLAEKTGRCVSSLAFSIEIQYELEEDEE